MSSNAFAKRSSSSSSSRPSARSASARVANANANVEVAPRNGNAARGRATVARSAARTSRTASKKNDATYLSLYFREMANLEVLRPTEEFGAAEELERLEIGLWQTLLAFSQTRDLVLDILDSHTPNHVELKALRGSGKSAKAFERAIVAASTTLRKIDNDKLFIDDVLANVDRWATGTGSRGATPASVMKSRAFAAWHREVKNSEHAVRRSRDAFVKANLRLVVSIARRYSHGRMALADIIQEGNLGLIKAVERYDFRRGFRFSTYASWWIRHAISRALADKGREIRLPVHMIDAQHRLAKASRQLTGELGRVPTITELAEMTKIPIDKIEKMRSWSMDTAIPIDRPSGDDDGRSLSETLVDPDGDVSSPTDALAFEALTTELQQQLTELRPIEADILRQRFGLVTEQELTLKQIGDKYNLSRERIRQLQEQALEKLRKGLQRVDMF